MRARPISVGLLSFIVLIIVGFASTGSVLSAGHDSPPFLFTVAKQYDPLAWIRGADRFSSDATVFLQDANGKHPLVPSFGASADPSVSFDGKNVLFAGKKSLQDPWQIWEVSLSGEEPRRITSCEKDCVRPFYLPEDRVVYAKKSDGRFVIEAIDRADGRTTQLTWNSGNSLPTDILRDGRILFESTYPLGADGSPELYTVYSDGSGVESYRCDHGQARYSGKQVESGDIVFASRFWSWPVHFSVGPRISNSNACRRLRRRCSRNFVRRLAGHEAGGEKAVSTIVVGAKQRLHAAGCGGIGRKCASASAGCGTHRTETPSVRTARLAECESSLSECLYLQIQVRIRIAALCSAVHTR